jgi:flagellar biosynthesis protein FlhG
VSAPDVPRAEATPPLIAVVSGKGGVGKTNLAANLAVAAARGGARVLLADGALGVSNVDVLLGLAPQRTLADVAEGRCGLEDALAVGPAGLAVLPAAGGRADLAALGARALAPLALALRRLAAGYDLALLDAATGVGPAVVALAGASPRRLLVATPEPTSLADAYAALKVLDQEAGPAPVALVVNEADGEREARAVHERLSRLAERFLQREVGWLGWLPRDRLLAAAVARQRAVVEIFPRSPAAWRLVELAERLLAEARAPALAGERPAARGSGGATAGGAGP